MYNAAHIESESESRCVAVALCSRLHGVLTTYARPAFMSFVLQQDNTHSMPQQLTCLPQLADWLEYSRNPRAIECCLGGQLLKLDAGGRPTLEQALADITALWCHQHGEAVLSQTDA
jgi:hypothetical protein